MTTWAVRAARAADDGDDPIEIDIEPGTDSLTSGGPRVTVGESTPATRGRGAIVEIVVDGWRFELEVEEASRARLRAGATADERRHRADAGDELRAIIPGRVVAVSVSTGDRVVAGQPLLVVEAMKMQNELRSPRDGIVVQLAVGPGQTIELGDLLAVIAEATDAP
jgi:biotin carboxyl carrier protein